LTKAENSPGRNSLSCLRAEDNEAEDAVVPVAVNAALEGTTPELFEHL